MAGLPVSLRAIASVSINGTEISRLRIDSQTGLIVGEPWFEHQVGKNEELVFPVDFNTDFTAQQSFRMKVNNQLVPIYPFRLII